MTNHQARLYETVNGPFADRLQSTVVRRAVVLATIPAAAGVALAFLILENGFWMLAAAAVPLGVTVVLLNLSLRGIFELADERLDEYQTSVRNSAYKTAYGLTLVFLIVFATVAAGMELQRQAAFAVAVFAFLMSALAPRMLLAWNLEDGSGQ